MDRVQFGKRFCLLVFCFGIAVWIGYTLGGRLPKVRVVLMPEEMATVDGSIRLLLDRLRKPALVLVAWYFMGLVCVGNRTVAKVAFPLLSAGRGVSLGICLSMADVLGNPLPGLVCYALTTVLLLGFAAGESISGMGKTTGRFLTHAGAVFAMTLVLGVI